MSITIDDETVVLKQDGKRQLARLKTVEGWITTRRHKGESLEDFQERVQKTVDAMQVRSRACEARASGRTPCYRSTCGAAQA